MDIMVSNSNFIIFYPNKTLMVMETCVTKTITATNFSL